MPAVGWEAILIGLPAIIIASCLIPLHSYIQVTNPMHSVFECLTPMDVDIILLQIPGARTHRPHHFVHVFFTSFLGFSRGRGLTSHQPRPFNADMRRLLVDWFVSHASFIHASRRVEISNTLPSDSLLSEHIPSSGKLSWRHQSLFTLIVDISHKLH